MVLRQNANGGLEMQESTRGNFDAGNTMHYDHDAKTFTFDVEVGSGVFSDVIHNVMLTRPTDGNLNYNDEAWVLAAAPYLFGNIFEKYDIAPVDFEENPEAASQFLSDLAESDNENAQQFIAEVSDYVSNYLSDDFFNYIGENGSFYSQLRLDNTGATTNYTTLGIWSEPTTPGEESTIGVAVWGMRTPDYEVPTTGTASYAAAMAGHILQNNNTQFLTGSINFDFDFGAHTMAFTMDADIAELGIDGSMDYFDYDTFTGDGNIYLDTFVGGFVSDSDDSLAGELEGAFFGADADEVAGTFVFGNENVQGIGGFVGANPDATSQQ